MAGSKSRLYGKKRKKSLAFFNQNFDYSPPYTCVVDSEFWSTTQSRSVDLREALPKILRGPVKICMTRCILKTVPKEGFWKARRLKNIPCTHEGRISSDECIMKLAGTNEHRSSKLVICSDSDHLRRLIRNNGKNSLGIPTIHTRIARVGGNFHLHLAEASPCQLGLAKRKQEAKLFLSDGEKRSIDDSDPSDRSSTKKAPKKKKRKRRTAPSDPHHHSGMATSSASTKPTKRQRKKMRAKERKQRGQSDATE